MKLPESWTEDCAELLRAFYKEGVEYLLFGSMAKSPYRHSPASVGDVDVLLNPTLENAKKVKPALDFVVPRICGGSLPDRAVEDLAKPGKQLVLGSFAKPGKQLVLGSFAKPGKQLVLGSFAKPGKQLVLGSFGSYLQVDLFTANREFDFCEAFSRIAVEVVDGIPARVASESDLKILGLTDRSALTRPRNTQLAYAGAPGRMAGDRPG